jgi:hypothetical protein
MPLGEAIFENFKLISNNPTTPDSVLDLPKFSQSSCCYELPVFAELVFTKDFNNDKSSVIWFYDNAFSDSLLELEQYISGAWTKVADLNDNTYGTYYAFGFFENSQQEKAVGFEIDWKLILSGLGAGKYRVKTVETNIFGTTNKYSLEWSLKTYSSDIANKTTRISWWMNGITGDSKDDQKVRDFGSLDWFNEIRLPNSLFWSKTSEYEKDYIQYQNGQKVWIQDERTRSYKFELRQAPNYIHELLSGETFQADSIMITDFNGDNPAMDNNCNPELIEKFIKLSSSYEPSWVYGSKLASVELTFINEYQNFIRKRC